MRFIILLFLYSTIEASSQDCDAVNRVMSYRGIKFYQEVPDSLKSVSIPLKNDFFNEYIVPKDNHDVALPDIVDRLLTFGDKFNSISFQCLPNDRIYAFYLIKKIAPKDTATASLRTLFSKNVINEIKRLFGNPTEQVTRKTELGTVDSYIWECTTIKIEFQLSLLRSYRFYQLTITDNSLERLKKVRL